ncbi:NIPSNAP family protein [Pyxidicoccus caerfyrddinensis]|uniref:NIPSNAP family protein n=1 Tax=Pyxidicoccus caerfyrddinensis TaxID=2709663 RepID=UPI0013DC2E13|nr:NIPSNAP family protein [Pyxidicoccus caerfyrddinensis]
MARRWIEVRSYNLKPGTRQSFHDLFLREALPMLKRWKVDVVSAGPSPQDDVSYFLIRAYDSVADRDRSQDAFYGSDEWRKGPREAILAFIESFTSVMLEVDEATIQDLRRTGADLSR